MKYLFEFKEFDPLDIEIIYDYFQDMIDTYDIQLFEQDINFKKAVFTNQISPHIFYYRLFSDAINIDNKYKSCHILEIFMDESLFIGNTKPKARFIVDFNKLRLNLINYGFKVDMVESWNSEYKNLVAFYKRLQIS